MSGRDSRNARRPGCAWRVPPPARPGPVRSRAVNRCNASERRSSEHVGAPSIQNRCARRANEWQRLPKIAPAGVRRGEPCHALWGLLTRSTIECVPAYAVRFDSARYGNENERSEWIRARIQCRPSRNARRPGCAWRVPPPARPGPVRSRAVNRCNASERRSSEHVGAPSIQNRCARRANEWQRLPKRAPAGMCLEGPATGAPGTRTLARG